MSSARKLHGIFHLLLEDGNQKRVYIYKKGRSIFLDDGLGRLSEILVHPSNENTVEGWIREYKLCRPNIKIKDYQFLLPGDKPHFL